MANRYRKVKSVADFIFGGSKITEDGDYSHEIKRHLLLGRKVMTNLDSILRSRDITLSTKHRLLKAMVFPVVMYGCESWTIKKAEHWRTDAFEVWYWRRLLAPWTARRSNQSILKRSVLSVHWNSDVEAETAILWQPDVKSWLIWKDPDAGKDWGPEVGITEDEMVGCHHWLNGHAAAAAAAAKSLQSWPTLCDPIDGSPPGSPIPVILQARTLEWVAISFSNAWRWNVKVNSLSCVRLLATPRTAAHQAPPSLWCSRQQYWSGVPLPFPQWTWVWVNSRSWWWTGRPGVLRFVG